MCYSDTCFAPAEMIRLVWKETDLSDLFDPFLFHGKSSLVSEIDLKRVLLNPPLFSCCFFPCSITSCFPSVEVYSSGEDGKYGALEE